MQHLKHQRGPVITLKGAATYTEHYINTVPYCNVIRLKIHIYGDNTITV